jgi:hypothetical protein
LNVFEQIVSLFDKIEESQSRGWIPVDVDSGNDEVEGLSQQSAIHWECICQMSEKV